MRALIKQKDPKLIKLDSQLKNPKPVPKNLFKGESRVSSTWYGLYLVKIDNK